MFLAYFAKKDLEEAQYLKEIPGVTFSDEDLLLGTSEHNRPLYVSATVNGTKLNRILVDPGASVHIMNVNRLSFDTDKLSSDKLMLRG